jgi:hypothetical protein
MLLNRTVVKGYSGAGASAGVWMRDVFEIKGSGTSTLDFCYVKNGSSSQHLDAGFVDKAFYTPTGPASAPLAQTEPPTVTHATSLMLDHKGKAIAPSSDAVKAWQENPVAPGRTKGERAIPQRLSVRP